MKIGGNVYAVLQKSSVTENEIGEQEKTWTDVQRVRGWLDLMSGESKYRVFNAKIEESTHIFMTDYFKVPAGTDSGNSRMVIEGKVYDVLLIDNPLGMGSGSHLEIYLKYTGGQ